MTTHALMELADTLVSEATYLKEVIPWTVGGVRERYQRHAELMEQAATQLRTAAAEGGKPIGYCDPTNPFNGEAFSWPGTARDPEHTIPLYLHPPTDSGAGRDGWISVEDRLPTDDERVITFGNGGFGGSPELDVCWFRKGTDCFSNYNVTHWQPLPETPKDTAMAGAAGEND